MERKQGLIGGFLGQKGEDGSEGRDASSGTAGGSDADGSPPKGKRVDAYEEDWYRSLKALAERRAQIAEEDEEEAPAASQPPDQPSPEPEPPAPEELEQPAAEIEEPPAPEELEQPAAEIAEPTAAEVPGQPAAAVPEPWNQPAATEPYFVEAPQPEAPYSLEPVEPALAGVAEPGEPAETVEPGEPAEAFEALEAFAYPVAEVAPIHAYGAPPDEALEAEPETAGTSLTAPDPAERRLALRELAERGLGDGELEQVVGLVLDPDQEVRRLALEVLSSRADRVDDATIKQALMDPADEVRATAVRLAAERGSRDLVLLAPLVAARRWPLTQAAALDLLPELLASTSTLGETELDLLLTSIGEMDPPPTMEEGTSIARLSRAAGISRLVGSLSLPDVRRLGAVRILVEGEEAPEILRALATLVSDPLDEIREVAEVAADAIARTEEYAAAGSEFSDDAPLAPAEAERIASLVRSLHDADEAVRHLARSGLGGVERNRVLAWAREAMHTGDLETASAAAETVGALRLYEIGLDILNRAIELPLEAREPFLKALARVRLEDLVGLLGQVDESRKPEAIRVLWNSSGPTVLPYLRAHLDDPSVPVRLAVLEVMGESGDPSSVEVARFVLETDQSPPLRAAAVRVISRANMDTSDVMTRAMADLDPVVRAAALEELTAGLGREADPFLLQGLSDGDEPVRRAAMNQLASREDNDHEFVWSALRQCRTEERNELGSVFSYSNQAALTQLALMHYGSPDQEERVLALELAGWSGSQACLEASIQSLQDPVPAVRAAAASALGRLRDTSAVRALGNAIGDPFPEVRVEAVRALGVIDDEAVLGFLVAALQDADPWVRTVASEVLTQWSSPAVAKRLAGVLAVPNLRGAAIDLLKKIGPSSQELLIDVLLHGSPEVVPIVGDLLGDVVGVGRLAGRLGSTEADGRLRAVEAIGAIGGPDAVEALVGVLSDPDERIRLRTTQLLAALGDPRGARAIVDAVLNDPVPEIVAAAVEALTRLGVRSGDAEIA
jgi:HEAT repeat protein